MSLTEKNEFVFSSSKSLSGMMVLGCLIFFAMLFGSIYFAIETIIEVEYQLIPIWVIGIFFSAYLLKIGFQLYNYKNVEIKVDDDQISISNKGMNEVIAWTDEFTIKNSAGMQTYSLFNSKGKLLFIIDYYSPDFSTLKMIVTGKKENPMRSISDILTPIEPTEEEIFEAKQKAKRDGLLSLFLLAYLLSSSYCLTKFGRGYEFNGAFIFFPYIYPVVLIPAFLLVNSSSSYSSRNILSKIIISLLTGGMIALMSSGYVAAINTAIGKQSAFVLSGTISEKGCENQKLFTISNSELNRDVKLEMPRDLYERYNQGDHIEIEMIKGSLGILYTKKSR